MRTSIVGIRIITGGGTADGWDEDRRDIDRWENDGGRTPENDRH